MAIWSAKIAMGKGEERAKPLFRHAGAGDGALMCHCWMAWLLNVSLGWLIALFDHGTGWQRSENDWMNSLSCYVWEKEGKHFKLGQGVLENSAELSDEKWHFWTGLCWRCVNGIYVKYRVSFIPPCLTSVGCCKGCSFETVAILLLLGREQDSPLTQKQKRCWGFRQILVRAK